MTPFPNKRYEVIYADPPWNHNGSGMGNISGEWKLKPADHYPTIPTDVIASMSVKQIANDDSLLFLWAVSPMLDDAIGVGTAWGFKFMTVGFVWHKQTSLAGYYTMSQCEMCLIFKRGKIPQPRGKRNIKQFLSCKRGRHSEKPWEIRQRITEMFPTQSKIELFARTPELLQPASGWDVWGNEAHASA